MNRHKIITTRIAIAVFLAAVVMVVVYGVLHFIPEPIYNSPLVINEIACNNLLGVQDADGNYPDWIELYNTTNEPIDLSGYGLSDDADEPYKHTFPEGTTIAGKTYKMIYAASSHTEEADYVSFGLSTKETVVLTDATGKTVDRVRLPEKVKYGETVGRTKDECNTFAVLATPTPGDFNHSAIVQKYFQQSDEIHAPVFSVQGGAYDGPFSLQLKTPEQDAVIYYTLDGSVPDEHSMVYKQPIPITRRDGEKNANASIQTSPHYLSFLLKPSTQPVYKGTVVRARSCVGGVFSAETETQTYFIEPNYSMPMLCITADHDALFSEEDGLLMPGEDMRLWKKYNPDASSDAPLSIQVSQDTIEGYVELFESDGTRAFGDRVGLSVSGKFSSCDRRKSLVVQSGKKYGSKGEFAYDLFAGEATDVQGKTIQSFKNFVVRNCGGNVGEDVMYRDAFLQILAKPAFETLQACRPCILFINGEYWGLFNLRERLGPNYFHNHFGVRENSVDILKYSSKVPQSTAGNESAVEEFCALGRYVEEHDLSQDTHYDYVAQRLDIDDALQYYALEVYLNNGDWLANNVRVWRSSDDASPYGDGKWRFALYDLDRGLLPGSTELLERVMQKPESMEEDYAYVSILRGLLQNESFRSRFMALLNSYMNTVFEPKAARETLSVWVNQIALEIPQHNNRWKMERGFLGKIMDYIHPPQQVDYDALWAEEMNRICEQISERPAQMQETLKKCFGEDVAQ